MSTFRHDKAEWHLDDAVSAYCKQKGIPEAVLTEEDYDKISDFTCTHLGFIWMWTVRHGFEGEMHHEPELLSAVEQLRMEKITGNEYMFFGCDSQLTCYDFADEIIDFINAYYDDYLLEYQQWVEKNAPGSLYCLPCTWELYYKIEPMIDQAYDKFKTGKLKKSFWSRIFSH